MKECVNTWHLMISTFTPEVSSIVHGCHSQVQMVIKTSGPLLDQSWEIVKAKGFIYMGLCPLGQDGGTDKSRLLEAQCKMHQRAMSLPHIGPSISCNWRVTGKEIRVISDVLLAQLWPLNHGSWEDMNN